MNQGSNLIFKFFFFFFFLANHSVVLYRNMHILRRKLRCDTAYFKPCNVEYLHSAVSRLKACSRCFILLRQLRQRDLQTATQKSWPLHHCGSYKKFSCDPSSTMHVISLTTAVCREPHVVESRNFFFLWGLSPVTTFFSHDSPSLSRTCGKEGNCFTMPVWRGSDHLQHYITNCLYLPYLQVSFFWLLSISITTSQLKSFIWAWFEVSKAITPPTDFISRLASVPSRF
jgi:hypothetical protein